MLWYFQVNDHEVDHLDYSLLMMTVKVDSKVYWHLLSTRHDLQVKNELYHHLLNQLYSLRSYSVSEDHRCYIWNRFNRNENWWNDRTYGGSVIRSPTAGSRLFAAVARSGKSPFRKCDMYGSNRKSKKKKKDGVSPRLSLTFKQFFLLEIDGINRHKTIRFKNE